MIQKQNHPEHVGMHLSKLHISLCKDDNIFENKQKQHVSDVTRITHVI